MYLRPFDRNQVPRRFAVLAGSRIGRRAEEFLDLRFVEHFPLLQVPRPARRACRDARSAVPWPVSAASCRMRDDFFVDELRRVLAELALLVDFRAQERMLLAGAIGDRAEPLAHAPVRRPSGGPDCVACFRSFSAPALYSSKTSFSAARPPSMNTSRPCSSRLADVQADLPRAAIA